MPMTMGYTIASTDSHKLLIVGTNVVRYLDTYGWGHLKPEYADICLHRKGGVGSGGYPYLKYLKFGTYGVS
jgi:hypothetical protein